MRRTVTNVRASIIYRLTLVRFRLRAEPTPDAHKATYVEYKISEGGLC